MQFLSGREKEIKLLNDLRVGNQSEFVVIYGRRRVGKTFLIRKVFNNDFHFHITGRANVGTKEQLINFDVAISHYIATKKKRKPTTNWFDAFQQLIILLSTDKSKKQKVLFIDEMPWLDTMHSGFISALEHFWNSWASARRDILLIVCGSSASWMINKLINNKGGLHNRVTKRIQLEPFTLNECEDFFKMRKLLFSRYDIVQFYMVMGGIPFYLEQIEKGQSVAQNIDRLCFSKNGFLRLEYDNLYTSLFKNPVNYILIIEALGIKAKGFSRTDVLKITKLANGGRVTNILNELEQCGFIKKYVGFGKFERDSLYQLVDFYSLFYFKFIRKASILDKNIWLNGLDTPVYKAWSGYAFEQVCMAHLDQIKKGLGISGVQTNSSSWISNKKNSNGAQIDLLIDRRDNVVNICEIKYSLNSFVITKKYAQELRNKVGVFKSETATRKSVYMTLITTFGVENNIYKGSSIQNELTMDVLFEKT